MMSDGVYEEMDTGRIQAKTSKLSSEGRNKFKEVGPRMTLKDFCSSSKKGKLPRIVKFCTGHTSLCERYSCAKDQLFVILEIKTINVVKMRIPRKGSTNVSSFKVLEIPMEIDMFTVTPFLHSQWKNDLSRGGHVQAHQLLKCTSLPRIARVVSGFTTDNGVSVPSGAILFPREVKKKTKELCKRVLVAKLEDGTSVDITAECTSAFDISHAASRSLSLSETIKCISLPLHCALQSDHNDLHSTKTVIITSVDKGTFLFGVAQAKQGSVQDDIDSFKELSEISANLDVSVIPMEPENERILGNIYKSAQLFYNRLNRQPSNTTTKQQVLPAVSSSDGSHTLDLSSPGYVTMTSKGQSRINVERNPAPSQVKFDQTHASQSPQDGCYAYATVMTGGTLSPDKGNVIQRGVPPDVSMSSVSKKSASSVSRVPLLPPTASNPQPPHTDVYYSTADAPQKPAATSPPLTRGVPGLSSLQKTQSSQKRPLPHIPLTAGTGTMSDIYDTTESDIFVDDAYMSANYTYIYTDDVIGETPKAIAPITPKPKSRASAASGVPSTGQANAPTSPQQQSSSGTQDTEAISSNEPVNIEVLRSLDKATILELLDAMNLGVYKDAFAKEFIDGEVLSEIDNGMLRELGVQNSLHRMRLMRIVRGKESVNSFLNKP